MSITVPNGLTVEYGASLEITTERSNYVITSQSDNKVEVSIKVGEYYRHYQTTFTDLFKILEKADRKESQTRELVTLKNQGIV